MRAVRWIVQRPVAGDPSLTCERISRACQELSLPFQAIDVAPGQPVELPPLDGPAVIHGRKTLLHAALADPVYRRTVFLDLETFTPEASLRAWGPRMLNAEQQVLTWSEVWAQALSPRVFVRPNDDDKLFVGHVFSRGELRVFYDEMAARGRLSPTGEVVVAPEQEIDAEARVFVVDGEIVGGSYYRPDYGTLLPDDLLEVATEAVRTWTPAPIFALDLARVEGVYRLLETNCFNGSGFHGASVAAIVERVSLYQRTREG